MAKSMNTCLRLSICVVWTLQWGGIEALAKSLHQLEPRWSVGPGTEEGIRRPANLNPTGAKRPAATSSTYVVK